MTQQRLSCDGATAELRLHTAEVAGSREPCASGISASKAGRCAACHEWNVRELCSQTSCEHGLDRQKSWKGREGDDQRARVVRTLAHKRRCVVEGRSQRAGSQLLFPFWSNAKFPRSRTPATPATTATPANEARKQARHTNTLGCSHRPKGCPWPRPCRVRLHMYSRSNRHVAN